jgi:HPr kinase/phosphorylase
MSASGISVRALLGVRTDVLGLPLELVAGGAGLDRLITSPHPQKTGLALAGFHDYLKPGRVLILGESEIRYLEELDLAAHPDAVRLAMAHDFPCILVTGGLAVPAVLQREAERVHLPVLRTAVLTPTAMAKLGMLLEDHLAERVSLHAVLMDVLGLGVLISGESGIGKSECALDLVARGHRLVADDIVEVRRRSETILIGTCPEPTRHHMEVRGLGMINVKELFGVASTRSSKRLEFIVRLERWEAGREYERLGLEDHTEEILGLKIPLVTMPVASGRNIAILVEVAARNQILRTRGHHAARLLVERLERSLIAPPAADDDDDELEGEDA